MKEWVKKNQKFVAYIINLIHWILVVVQIVIVVEVMTVIKIKIDMTDCQSIREGL